MEMAMRIYGLSRDYDKIYAYRSYLLDLNNNNFMADEFLKVGALEENEGGAGPEIVEEAPVEAEIVEDGSVEIVDDLG